MLETVRLTKQAVEALAGRSVQSWLYEKLNLQEPAASSFVTQYKGITILSFESDIGGKYYAFAPCHSTLCGRASNLAEATEQVQLAIDRLLELRPLSRLEQQIVASIGKAVGAMFSLSGKAAALALGKALANAMPQSKAMGDSCYLLGYKLTSLEPGVDGKASDWAANELLKHHFTTGPIEDHINTLLGAKL